MTAEESLLLAREAVCTCDSRDMRYHSSFCPAYVPASSNGHKTKTTPASAADRPALPDAVGVALDRVDLLRRRYGKDVQYQVRVTWGCGQIEKKLYRKRWDAERKVQNVTEQGARHYSHVPDQETGKALKFHKDTGTVVVDGWMLITEDVFDSMISRECECGCGESFYPVRSDQRFVNATHRKRANRAVLEAGKSISLTSTSA